jgi:hypothetical protein
MRWLVGSLSRNLIQMRLREFIFRTIVSCLGAFSGGLVAELRVAAAIFRKLSRTVAVKGLPAPRMCTLLYAAVFLARNPAFGATAEHARLPDFVAEGTVVWEQFQPLQTNYVVHVDSHFVFIYTNEVWEIQTAYKHYYHPTLPGPDASAGTIVDCKRIPDGNRLVTIFANDTNSKFAIAQRGAFPPFQRPELFLAWLTLCPNAELPLVNSNSMRFNFSPELDQDPNNQGPFDREYLPAENIFLSKLNVTNNGTYYIPGTGLQKYPGFYADGYTEFSYQLNRITNVGKLSFPSSSTLTWYVPRIRGKSKADLSESIVATLSVDSINAAGQATDIVPMPDRLIAIDSRLPQYKGDTSPRYEVLNDSWPPFNDPRLARLARAMASVPARYEQLNTHRHTVLAILAAIMFLPLLFYFGVRLYNKQNKTKET